MRRLSPPTRDQHAKQERDSQGLKGRLPGHIVEVVSKTLHNRLKTFGRGLQVIGHVPDGLGSSPNTRLIACSGVRTDLVRHERFSRLDIEQQIPTELGSEAVRQVVIERGFAPDLGQARANCTAACPRAFRVTRGPQNPLPADRFVACSV